MQEYSTILPVYILSLDLVSHKQKEFVRQLKISIGVVYVAKKYIAKFLTTLRNGESD